MLPYLAPPRSVPSLWQIFGLTLLVFGLFGIVFLSSLFVVSEGLLDLWQQTGGLAMLLGIVLGVVGYASTVIYGRVLAENLSPKRCETARRAARARWDKKRREESS